MATTVNDYNEDSILYERTNWKNMEAGGTPIDETNLNNIENGIVELVERSNTQDEQITDLSEATQSLETFRDSISPLLVHKPFNSTYNLAANTGTRLDFNIPAMAGYTAISVAGFSMADGNVSVGAVFVNGTVVTVLAKSSNVKTNYPCVFSILYCRNDFCQYTS